LFEKLRKKIYGKCAHKCESSPKWAVKEQFVLPMILVRNEIRDMLGGEIGKITFRRIKNKFRTPFIKINLPDKLANP
jgi:hypothetical protein